VQFSRARVEAGHFSTCLSSVLLYGNGRLRKEELWKWGGLAIPVCVPANTKKSSQQVSRKEPVLKVLSSDVYMYNGMHTPAVTHTCTSYTRMFKTALSGVREVVQWLRALAGS